ncbi:MAG: GspH/FimT family pseudopilin [Acidobacteria bacterium]|nr:GspH/FimT family pseudopilin [Acidobacteriota bacterium]
MSPTGRVARALGTPGAPQRCPRPQRGFSVAELLVALTIIGMIAGIGAYVINTGGWRDSAAVSELARRMEHARSRAVLDGNDWIVTFNVASASYTILDDDNSDGDYDQAIGESQWTYPLAASASGTVFGYPDSVQGIDGTSLDDAVTFAGDQVTFRPLGTADNGVAYIVTANDIRAGDPQYMRALVVNAATGRIRRWRYEAGANNPGPWRLER